MLRWMTFWSFRNWFIVMVSGLVKLPKWVSVTSMSNWNSWWRELKFPIFIKDDFQINVHYPRISVESSTWFQRPKSLNTGIYLCSCHRWKYRWSTINHHRLSIRLATIGVTQYVVYLFIKVKIVLLSFEVSSVQSPTNFFCIVKVRGVKRKLNRE